MSMTAPIRPLYQAQTYRDLLFIATAIPVAAAALGIMIAGWTSIVVLAITPLIVPVLLGYRGVVGLLARGDAALARSLLGAETGPTIVSSGRGFWGRAKAVFLDPNFWRQQGYLLLRMTVGFALAVGELALIAGAFGWISLPIWYRWTDNDFGSWHVDTLGRAFLFVPAGVVALVAAAWLARGIGSLSAWQVRSLLAPRPEGTSPADALRLRRRALSDRARRRRRSRPADGDHLGLHGPWVLLADVGRPPAGSAVRDPRWSSSSRWRGFRLRSRPGAAWLSTVVSSPRSSSS